MFKPSFYQQAIFQNLGQGQGHTVVVARAGSGKTTTLVEGLNYLPPGRTLLVAFNRDIKEELRKRAPSRVKVQTLHGLGLATLKRHPAFEDAEPDEKKGHRLAREALNRTNWAGSKDAISVVQKAAKLAKATLTQTREALQDLIEHHGLDDAGFPTEDIAEAAAKAVRAAVDDRNTIDFDDMVWLPIIHKMRPFQNDYVFVDEAQDLSPAQLALTRAACRPGGRIIAVGDPMQAIYAWRGADLDTLERIKQELNATELPLSVCYRCPTEVIKVAQRYVDDIEPAPDAEPGMVVDVNYQEMLDDVRPGDYVLSRSNRPLVRVYEHLTESGVPSKIAGRDIARSLISVIRKSKARTTTDFLDWLQRKVDVESERLKDRPRILEAFLDRAGMLRDFAEHIRTTAGVIRRIEQTFDDKNGSQHVLLSTVHKAKGRERDRVFVLEDTFFRWPGQEEKNVFYVAVTRARRELYFVDTAFAHRRASDR
jgi:DNA helicase-2/ATP-dependent DNA helicase PcrA